jgi:hypothetical protein
MLLVLLKNKWRLMVNALLKASPGKRRGRLLAGVVFLGVPVYFSWQGVLMLSSLVPRGADAILLYPYIRTAMTGVFVLLLFGGISVSVQVLYLSTDLGLLRMTPISDRTVIQYKWAESLLSNVPVLVYFGLSFLVSIGLVLRAPWTFYVLLPVVALIFATIPTSLAALVSNGLLFILSPRRAKQIFRILLVLVFAVLWLAFNNWRQRVGMLNPTMEFQGVGDTTLGGLWPWDMMSQAIFALGVGTWQPAIVSISLLAVLAILSSQLSWFVTERLYRQGELDESRWNRKKISSVRATAYRGVSCGVSPVFRSLLRKETHLVFRDPKQVIQLLLYTAMMMGLALVSYSPAEATTPDKYFPVLGIVFFTNLVSLHQSAQSIPLESRAIQYLKVVPRPTSLFIRVKWCFGSGLALALGCPGLVLMGIRLQWSMGEILGLVGILLLFVIGGVPLGLTLGAWFGQFRWQDNHRLLSTGGYLVSMLLSALYSGTGILLLSSIWWFSWTIPALTLFIFFVIFTGLMGTLVAVKKLEQLDWIW